MHTSKNRYIQILTLLTLMCFQSAAIARSIMNMPESYSLEFASIVLEARITLSETLKSGDTLCGSHYHAEITKVIKGEPTRTVVDFGYLMGLEIGTTYKIFLKPIQSRSELVELLGSRITDTHELDKFVSACGDLIPKFRFFRADKVDK